MITPDHNSRSTLSVDQFLIRAMPLTPTAARNNVTIMFQEIAEHLAKILMHGNSPEGIKEWRDEIKNKYVSRIRKHVNILSTGKPLNNDYFIAALNSPFGRPNSSANLVKGAAEEYTKPTVRSVQEGIEMLHAFHQWLKTKGYKQVIALWNEDLLENDAVIADLLIEHLLKE